ncbi:MBL fold metallo-hydrolase [Streptomyces avidinii]|uniref:MBL fold metallo-hydrolase n=1 Tax=Streptomyces avidinii TaxID=1895 RepID=UPI0037BB5A26
MPVHAPADADIPGLEVNGVSAGAEFTAAGFRIRAVGGRHAFIYGGQPDCANLGYVIDDALYHPGDSLHVPEQEIETLLVPVHGSWLKTVEAIDFVKAVAPQRAFAIHDAQINERGLGSVNGWLTQRPPTATATCAPANPSESEEYRHNGVNGRLRRAG